MPLGASTSTLFAKCSRLYALRMDARQHEDLIFIISQAILDARYAPPKRRRSAWGEGYNEDLEQARRVAAAIVEALRRSGFQISRKPPAPHHSTPKGP